jgi:hypothetical protein
MSRQQRLGAIGAGVAAVVAVIAVLAWLLLSSSSDVSAGSTILTVIGGEVSVQPSGEDKLRTAVDGEGLEQGDRVTTGADGRAVITFFDGSTQELNPNTDVTLNDVGQTDSGGLFARIGQSVGVTWNNVLNPEDTESDFQVETPASVGAVRDTLFQVQVLTDGVTEFWSRLGVVQVSAEEETQDVEPGTSSTTNPGEPPGEPVEVPPSRSEVTLTLGSSAWMLVIDPNGLASGILPPGFTASQIPLAIATDYTIEPQVVSMRDLEEGTYGVWLQAFEDGDYHLSMQAGSLGVKVSEEEFPGTVSADEYWKSDLVIELDDEGNLTGATLSEPVPTDEAPPASVVITATAEELIALRQSLLPSELYAGLFSGLPTATPVPSASPSPSPTPTPGALAASATPVPTLVPTATPSPRPIVLGLPIPTPTPTVRPTAPPTPRPTNPPTAAPTPPPTPVPTPTPTPVPPVQLGTLYLHNNPTPPTGNTSSHTILPMNGTAPTAGTLFNYDVNRDGADGLVIAKGGSQAWQSSAFPSGAILPNSVSVRLWTAMRNFDSTKQGSIIVYLRDFDAGANAYTTVGATRFTQPNWIGGSSTWGQVNVHVALIAGYQLAPGHQLELRIMVVAADSGDDLWFAYDTNAYPARIEVP